MRDIFIPIIKFFGIDILGLLIKLSKIFDRLSENDQSSMPTCNRVRPVTLLNQDYKILTKIITKLITSVLGSVCKSSQSCSIPGFNICSAASNLISIIEDVNLNKTYAALLSLGFFEAYDRVNHIYIFSRKVCLSVCLSQKVQKLG